MKSSAPWRVHSCRCHEFPPLGGLPAFVLVLVLSLFLSFHCLVTLLCSPVLCFTLIRLLISTPLLLFPTAKSYLPHRALLNLGFLFLFFITVFRLGPVSSVSTHYSGTADGSRWFLFPIVVLIYVEHSLFQNNQTYWSNLGCSHIIVLLYSV